MLGIKHKPGRGFRIAMCGVGLLLMLVTGFFDWAIKNPFPGALEVGLIAVIVVGMLAGSFIYKSVIRSAGEAKANDIDRGINWAGIAVLVVVGMILIKKYS